MSEEIMNLSVFETLCIKKPTKLGAIIASAPKPPFFIKSNDIPPLLRDRPLQDKVPLLPIPEKYMGTFTRGVLGEPVIGQLDSQDMVIYDPYNYEMERPYEAVHDPHLKKYFNKPVNKEILRRLNIVTDDDRVLCSLADYNAYRKYLHKKNLRQIKEQINRNVERKAEVRNYKQFLRNSKVAHNFSYKHDRVNTARAKCEALATKAPLNSRCLKQIKYSLMAPMYRENMMNKLTEDRRTKGLQYKQRMETFYANRAESVRKRKIEYAKQMKGFDQMVKARKQKILDDRHKTKMIENERKWSERKNQQLNQIKQNEFNLQQYDKYFETMNLRRKWGFNETLFEQNELEDLDELQDTGSDEEDDPFYFCENKYSKTFKDALNGGKFYITKAADNKYSVGKGLRKYIRQEETPMDRMLKKTVPGPVEEAVKLTFRRTVFLYAMKVFYHNMVVAVDEAEPNSLKIRGKPDLRHVLTDEYAKFGPRSTIPKASIHRSLCLRFDEFGNAMKYPCVACCSGGGVCCIPCKSNRPKVRWSSGVYYNCPLCEPKRAPRVSRHRKKKKDRKDGNAIKKAVSLTTSKDGAVRPTVGSSKDSVGSVSTLDSFLPPVVNAHNASIVPMISFERSKSIRSELDKVIISTSPRQSLRPAPPKAPIIDKADDSVKAIVTTKEQSSIAKVSFVEEQMKPLGTEIRKKSKKSKSRVGSRHSMKSLKKKHRRKTSRRSLAKSRKRSQARKQKSAKQKSASKVNATPLLKSLPFHLTRKALNDKSESSTNNSKQKTPKQKNKKIKVKVEKVEQSSSISKNEPEMHLIITPENESTAYDISKKELEYFKLFAGAKTKKANKKTSQTSRKISANSLPSKIDRSKETLDEEQSTEVEEEKDGVQVNKFLAKRTKYRYNKQPSIPKIEQYSPLLKSPMENESFSGRSRQFTNQTVREVTQEAVEMIELPDVPMDDVNYYLSPRVIIKQLKKNPNVMPKKVGQNVFLSPLSKPKTNNLLQCCIGGTSMLNSTNNFMNIKKPTNCETNQIKQTISPHVKSRSKGCPLTAKLQKQGSSGNYAEASKERIIVQRLGKVGLAKDHTMKNRKTTMQLCKSNVSDYSSIRNKSKTSLINHTQYKTTNKLTSYKIKGKVTNPPFITKHKDINDVEYTKMNKKRPKKQRKHSKNRISQDKKDAESYSKESVIREPVSRSEIEESNTPSSSYSTSKFSSTSTSSSSTSSSTSSFNTTSSDREVYKMLAKPATKKLEQVKSRENINDENYQEVRHTCKCNRDLCRTLMKSRESYPSNNAWKQSDQQSLTISEDSKKIGNDENFPKFGSPVSRSKTKTKSVNSGSKVYGKKQFLTIMESPQPWNDRKDSTGHDIFKNVTHKPSNITKFESVADKYKKIRGEKLPTYYYDKEGRKYSIDSTGKTFNLTSEGHIITADDKLNIFSVKLSGSKFYVDNEGRMYKLGENGKHLAVGKGNKYRVDYKGRKFFLDKDGQKFIVDVDGNVLLLDEDDRRYSIDPTGRKLYVLPDKRKTSVKFDAKGNIVKHGSPKKSKLPESSHFVEPGSKVYIDSEGCRMIFEKDGNIYYVDCNGKRYHVTGEYPLYRVGPDGEIYLEDAKGQKYYEKYKHPKSSTPSTSLDKVPSDGEEIEERRVSFGATIAINDLKDHDFVVTDLKSSALRPPTPAAAFHGKYGKKRIHRLADILRNIPRHDELDSLFFQKRKLYDCAHVVLQRLFCYALWKITKLEENDLLSLPIFLKNMQKPKMRAMDLVEGITKLSMCYPLKHLTSKRLAPYVDILTRHILYKRHFDIFSRPDRPKETDTFSLMVDTKHRDDVIMSYFKKLNKQIAAGRFSHVSFYSQDSDQFDVEDGEIIDKQSLRWDGNKSDKSEDFKTILLGTLDKLDSVSTLETSRSKPDLDKSTILKDDKIPETSMSSTMNITHTSSTTQMSIPHPPSLIPAMVMGSGLPELTVSKSSDRDTKTNEKELHDKDDLEEDINDKYALFQYEFGLIEDDFSSISNVICEEDNIEEVKPQGGPNTDTLSITRKTKRDMVKPDISNISSDKQHLLMPAKPLEVPTVIEQKVPTEIIKQPKVTVEVKQTEESKSDSRLKKKKPKPHSKKRGKSKKEKLIEVKKSKVEGKTVTEKKSKRKTTKSSEVVGETKRTGKRRKGKKIKKNKSAKLQKDGDSDMIKKGSSQSKVQTPTPTESLPGTSDVVQPVEQQVTPVKDSSVSSLPDCTCMRDYAARGIIPPCAPPPIKGPIIDISEIEKINWAAHIKGFIKVSHMPYLLKAIRSALPGITITNANECTCLLTPPTAILGIDHQKIIEIINSSRKPAKKSKVKDECLCTVNAFKDIPTVSCLKDPDIRIKLLEEVLKHKLNRRPLRSDKLSKQKLEVETEPIKDKKKVPEQTDKLEFPDSCRCIYNKNQVCILHRGLWSGTTQTLENLQRKETVKKTPSFGLGIKYRKRYIDPQLKQQLPSPDGWVCHKVIEEEIEELTPEQQLEEEKYDSKMELLSNKINSKLDARATEPKVDFKEEVPKSSISDAYERAQKLSILSVFDDKADSIVTHRAYARGQMFKNSDSPISEVAISRKELDKTETSKDNLQSAQMATNSQEILIVELKMQKCPSSTKDLTSQKLKFTTSYELELGEIKMTSIPTAMGLESKASAVSTINSQNQDSAHRLPHPGDDPRKPRSTLPE